MLCALLQWAGGWTEPSVGCNNNPSTHPPTQMGPRGLALNLERALQTGWGEPGEDQRLQRLGCPGKGSGRRLGPGRAGLGRVGRAPPRAGEVPAPRFGEVNPACPAPAYCGLPAPLPASGFARSARAAARGARERVGPVSARARAAVPWPAGRGAGRDRGVQASGLQAGPHPELSGGPFRVHVDPGTGRGPSAPVGEGRGRRRGSPFSAARASWGSKCSLARLQEGPEEPRFRAPRWGGPKLSPNAPPKTSAPPWTPRPRVPGEWVSE